MSDKADSLNSLVEGIYQLTKEWNKLRGEEDRQQLMPSANQAAISRLQTALGVTLPRDYLAMLRLHNGWKNFRADYSLLSIEEMVGDGPMKKVLARLKEMQGESEKTARHDGIIFQAGPFGWSCAYFDRSTHKTSGSMEVVEWEPRGEIERHPSFTAYLESYQEVLEGVVAKERKRLRR